MIGKIKRFIKKAIGKKNTHRVSILQASLSLYFNRMIRSASTIFEKRKKRSIGLKKFSVETGQTFFGYYDVTPFSEDNELLLAMVAPIKNHPPVKDQEISVGYFDRKVGGPFKEVSTTSTWCWQQGCRLQWFPENENELIIYNTMVKGFYGAVVKNIITKSIFKEYNRPIYAIDKEGDWALSLNFSRLNRLRPGYGYINIPDTTIGDQHPDRDGVWLINLDDHKFELLLSLKYLAQFDPLPSMKNADHYINHLSFNPSGSRFMFFHLWTQGNNRLNRLITCDRNGDNLRILEKDNYISHYTWKSDEYLLVTVHQEGLGTRYYLYNDETGRKSPFAHEYLTIDGHPSFSPDGSLLLTDTLLDRYGEQHLLMHSPSEGCRELGSFFSPLKFRWETRCDLHPRWDRHGRAICFDSAHEGERALYVAEIDD